MHSYLIRTFIFCVGFIASTSFFYSGNRIVKPRRFSTQHNTENTPPPNKFPRNYHYSQKYYEDAMNRLRSNNFTSPQKMLYEGNNTLPEITIILKGSYFQQFEDEDDDDDDDGTIFGEEDSDNDDDGDENKIDNEEDNPRHFNPFKDFTGNARKHGVPNRQSSPHRRENPYVRAFYQSMSQGSNDKEKRKSKNFEVMMDYNTKFDDVGGYLNIKDELKQSVDILKNYEKYSNYNVRIPKGLIFEGPPGNGKTLLAKSLAGEARCGFIAVSGSDFQEKYVGVGSSRIREMFELAKKNEPCIIFIDEIDAVGRHRSGDGESSSSERDNTLNALLVELDGFKNNTGVFVVGATNRMDLLDPALIRPGRIDKKIFIGLPDAITRKEVLRIHILGKPHDESVILDDLVDVTDGLSCAQIENLLNEAMLHTLRYNNTAFTYSDVDIILNKMVAGWQSNEHEFTQDMIDRITVHEMGHAILGYLSKHHSKLVKVVINLSSPKTPGYTVFERSSSSIYLKEALFEHLFILLGGRIAEEVIYNVSVTTGAINDFEEALKLAEKMIVYYGMGENVLYPSTSEKYKEIIDTEVSELINYAYLVGRSILENCKQLLLESSALLRKEKKLTKKHISDMIRDSYPDILILTDIFNG